MKENNKLAWFSNHGSDLISYGGLVFCLVIFSVLSSVNGTRMWSSYNIGIIIQAVSIYAVLTLGAMFIYSMGYMDISAGSQVGVYAIVFILVANKTGKVWVAFLSILGLALLSGFINGYVAVMLGLPSIVTSIFLMSIFGGVQVLIMEKIGINSLPLEGEPKNLLTKLNNMKFEIGDIKIYWFMIAVIAVVAVIVIFLYNYTRLGEIVKSIGANPTATQYSGINTTIWKVLAYAVFGTCVAVASFLLVMKTGAVGKGTGTGYAMDIMVSLLLGGMPLSGGMKSKVSSALIGSFTYVILSNGLTLAGVSTSVGYLIRALIFIAVILITCRKKDGVLPR